MRNYLLIALTLFSISLSAQNEGKLTFQGSLFQNGEPFSGTTELTFTIPLDDQTNWAETLSGVNVANGLYSVVLGNSQPIPLDLFKGVSERTITVSVDGTVMGEVSIYPSFVPDVIKVDSVFTNAMYIENAETDNYTEVNNFAYRIRNRIDAASSVYLTNNNSSRLQLADFDETGATRSLNFFSAFPDGNASLTMDRYSAEGTRLKMVDLYSSNLFIDGTELANGYSRGGIDLYNSEGEIKVFLTSMPGDTDGSDAEGNSAQLGLYGNNTINFTMEGKRWENNNLGAFSMYGEHTNGEGWFNRNIAMNVNSDGTNNSGQIELFKSVEGAGGEERVINIDSDTRRITLFDPAGEEAVNFDGNDGSAFFQGGVQFNGDVVINGTLTGPGVGGGGAPNGNEFNVNFGDGTNFVKADPNTSSGRFTVFSPAGTQAARIFSSGGNFGRFRLYSPNGENDTRLELGVNSNEGGYAQFLDAGLNTTVEINGENGSGYFSGDLTVDGNLNANIDPSVGDSNQGVLFDTSSINLFRGGDGSGNGDVALSMNSYDDGAGRDWGSLDLRADGVNMITLNGENGNAEFSGNVNSLATFTKFINVQNENDVPNFIAGTRDFDPNSSSDLGYMAVVGNVFDPNISAYPFASGINSYNDGTEQYAEFYQDITASDASYTRPMTKIGYDANTGTGFFELYDTQDGGSANNVRMGVDDGGMGYLELKGRNSEYFRLDGNGVVNITPNFSGQTVYSSGLVIESPGFHGMNIANGSDGSYYVVSAFEENNYGIVDLRDENGDVSISLQGSTGATSFITGGLNLSGDISANNIFFGGSNPVSFNNDFGGIFANEHIAGTKRDNSVEVYSGAIQAWASTDGDDNNQSGKILFNLTKGSGTLDYGQLTLHSWDRDELNESVQTINLNGENGEATFGDYDGSTGTGVYIETGSGNLRASGTVFAGGVALTSDKRLKKDIQPLNNSLDNISEMRGVSYTWSNKEKDQRNQIGVIAQEVEKIYPEFVHTDKNGMKSVNYSQMTAVLIEAIKELNAEVKILKTENEELKAEATKTAELSKRIDTIEKLLELQVGSTSNAKN